MPKKIAVIGSGISGLTCAYELQKAGFDVEVFEKEKTVGGRMATRKIGFFPFDIGADHLCNVYAEMKKYCEELHIEWVPMDFLGYQVFRGGKFYPLHKGVSWISRARLATALFFTKETDTFLNLTKLADLDTEDAYTYMTKIAGKEVADYLLDSFVSTYQFHRAHEISKAALVGIMSSIKYDNVKWNLHRMKGGMSALPEALAAKLTVRRETPVTAVKKRGDTVVVLVNGEEKIFDGVVFGATANVVKKLLEQQTPEQKKVLEGTRFASTLSLSFVIPKGIMPHNAIYWVPYVESKKISGMVNEMMKGDESAHEGMQVVNCWLHEEFAKTIISGSDQEIFDAVKEEFLRVSPWFDTTKHTVSLYDVQRWSEAMPVFSKGHITRVKEFLEKGQGEGNIWLTGDYLNSPWTEGALRCGQRVALDVQSTFSL